MKISEIKSNPNNPRLIKEEKFRKLVKSIKDFPEMMELRPIVIDENNVIQGGNMRYQALLDLKYKEIPDSWVKQGKDLSEDQWKQFVIKDNVGFGEWEWDTLANEWDALELQEWGLTLPFSQDDMEEMKNPDNEETENKFADELDMQSNFLVLKFDTDIDWLQAKTLFKLESVSSKRANGKAWSKGIGRVIDGVKAIKSIQNEN